MIKKRLTLSLVALVGSVFLFIVASFAWFAISDIVSLSPNTIQVQDIDVEATLYVSSNNIDFVEATSIDISLAMPGYIRYYKLVVSNNNNYAVSTQVKLYGFTDGYSDGAADTSNYTAGRSLMEVLYLDASNNINAETIINQAFDNLADGTDFITTHAVVDIPSSSSAELYFTITVSESAGNDYQNLSLDIDNLFVMSATD